MYLASAIASTGLSVGGLSALSGLFAAIIAAATFYMASRASKVQGTAANYAVDADAYKRGVEIYEATIQTLRTEVNDLRTEIRSLHEEISQMRKSNAELVREIEGLRNRRPGGITK
jgi:predicted RNase H-like nuclease (RuvC/YqgF family)